MMRTKYVNDQNIQKRKYRTTKKTGGGKAIYMEQYINISTFYKQKRFNTNNLVRDIWKRGWKRG